MTVLYAAVETTLSLHPTRIYGILYARETTMTFSELVRLLEKNGFKIVKEKGSVRYYGKPGCLRLIRIDFHGPKEVPTGTCRSILNAAGLN